MAERDDIIKFVDEDGEEVEFTVLEQTKLNGNEYLLVLDSFEDEDEEALIMKKVNIEGTEQNTYEIVDNEAELNAVASVFSSLLEDIELITD